MRLRQTDGDAKKQRDKMPEAPDLQVVKEFLQPRIVGRRITAVAERKPLTLRNLVGSPFKTDAVGRQITAIDRKGKLLLIEIGPDRSMIISAMLTGGLQYCGAGTRLMASTIIVLDVDDGMQLRYFDQKRMGQVYYTTPDARGEITRLQAQGPDVLDERLSLDEFKERLRPFRGEIKGVLTRGQAVSGIGNAYADEILFEAKIYPFTKRNRLSGADVERLHRAVYETPARAVETLRERVGANIHRKVRDFLKVHGKGGSPCPVCGAQITAITANRRETNYCRSCQPGTLFRR